MTHELGTPVPVRAPRGTTRTAPGWPQEAALRMLQNNLDPEVAEHPDSLVVYGGSGRAARDCLEAAMEMIISGSCRALVTAPVDKAALLAAGFPYPGHTDWLPARAGGRAVMMLLAGRLRVVPVTVHVPLKDVPRSLTSKLVLDTIKITGAELQARFRIKRPRLAVSGPRT